ASGAPRDAVRALHARVGAGGLPRPRRRGDPGRAALGAQAPRLRPLRSLADAPGGPARAGRGARAPRPGGRVVTGGIAGVRPAAVTDPRMRWWGWGVDRDAMKLPASTRTLIEQGLGVSEP